MTEQPQIGPVIGELMGLLKQSGQVTLGTAGTGQLFFDPDNARQRWEVTGVNSKTNQSSTASTVPIVTLGLNSTSLTTMSPGLQRDASWSGNQDSWAGLIDVGPCDYFTVFFSPPAGGASALSGVICSVVITGRKYTRRT